MTAIKYLWHASLLIEMWGKKLLVDPFISQNPQTQGVVNIDEIECDYILITHAHGDHIADVEFFAEKTWTLIISNFEIGNYYEKKWFKTHKINHGGKYIFDFGTLKYVNAIHTSTFPDGTNGGNPGGFVLWNQGKCLYIAGDTALCEDMKLIPLTCPKLDIAILPIGDNFTMWYEDACIAANFVGCKKILWYHYNTFPPIQIDTQKAQQAFENAEKKLLLPKIGETISI